MVEACIKLIPYGFGGAGRRVVLHWEENDEEQEETGDAGAEGAFILSFGDEGKLGQRVRECDIDGLELTSDMEPKLDDLLCARLVVDGTLLKTDLAGELVTEAVLAGDCGEGCARGTWASLRTAMRVRCNRFWANRLEIYSRALLR
jgi:hypothetical protein